MSELVGEVMAVEALAVAVLMASLVLAALHYRAHLVRRSAVAFDGRRQHIRASLLLTLALFIAAVWTDTLTIDLNLGTLGVLVLIGTALRSSSSGPLLALETSPPTAGD